MAKGSFVMLGSGEKTLTLPANMASFDYTDETEPGVPASNTQTGESVQVSITGKRGWWVFGTSSWKATFTWQDLLTTHTVTYTAS